MYSMHIWPLAGRYLEQLGLHDEDAGVMTDGSLAWTDEDDVQLPGELPSALGTLTAESTATATGEGRIYEIASYRLRAGQRIVILLENREDERWVQIWLADDARDANLIIHGEIERWLRIAMKATAFFADCPGGEVDRTPVFDILVRPQTGEPYFVPIDELEPIDPDGAQFDEAA